MSTAVHGSLDKPLLSCTLPSSLVEDRNDDDICEQRDCGDAHAEPPGGRGSRALHAHEGDPEDGAGGGQSVEQVAQARPPGWWWCSGGITDSKRGGIMLHPDTVP